eukprot:gnl/Trimastix_PCT/935.p1 GENE.gnl/Trimastix_PCT/935~~gnl/Trimastix_PCT/935.p1  ORF type:complete len:480 (+),score=160.11 gnl/Trimastix_PCT/935:52-1440(+)
MKKALCLFVCVLACALANYDALNAFLAIDKYHVEFELRYFDFHNLEVPQVYDYDGPRGRSCLSYHDGLDVLLITRANAYHKYVAKDTVMCDSVTAKMSPFPELTNLTYEGEVKVHQTLCKKYMHKDLDHATFYSVFLDARTGAPVRFELPKLQIDVSRWMPNVVNTTALKIPPMCGYNSEPVEAMHVAHPFYPASPSVSDLPWEVFEEAYLMKTEPKTGKQWIKEGLASPYTEDLENAKLPEEVDWTREGKVTPIKNQAGCGSCWAFAGTATFESHFAINDPQKRLFEFSEQNVVDCAWGQPYGNMGCNGGWGVQALRYIKEKQGSRLTMEGEYPYLMRNGFCKPDASKFVSGPRIREVVVPSTEAEIKHAVATKGPVAVHVAVTHNFQLYKSGVFTDTLCNIVPTNHVVTVVGYGTTADGQDYWKIKNSWGIHWGVNGYMYLKRGSNECGITDQAAFPIMG